MACKWHLAKNLVIWQTWTTKWNGHEITVKNWFTPIGLFTGEQVLIDGKLVYNERVLFRFNPKFTIEVANETPNTTLKVKMGMLWPTGLPGAHIYADDVLIGGDVDRRFKRWWEICLFCLAAMLVILGTGIGFIHYVIRPQDYHSLGARIPVQSRPFRGDSDGSEDVPYEKLLAITSRIITDAAQRHGLAHATCHKDKDVKIIENLCFERHVSGRRIFKILPTSHLFRIYVESLLGPPPRLTVILTQPDSTYMSAELIKASREIRKNLLNELPQHTWIEYFPEKDDPDPLKEWNGLEAGEKT